MNKLFLVFDVESIGLHGGAFALGYVVTDLTGEIHEQDCFSCYPSAAPGSSIDRMWVRENVPPIKVTYSTQRQVRDKFWSIWEGWRDKGAVLAADCVWPVEANFITACIEDVQSRREQGPYPIHEIASVLLAAGIDPLKTRKRYASELPVHHPLADARQSARLLVTALTTLLAMPAKEIE